MTKHIQVLSNGDIIVNGETIRNDIVTTLLTEHNTLLPYLDTEVAYKFLDSIEVRTTFYKVVLEKYDIEITKEFSKRVYAYCLRVLANVPGKFTERQLLALLHAIDKEFEYSNKELGVKPINKILNLSQ